MSTLKTGILMDGFYAFQYLPGMAGGEQIASLIHAGREDVAAGYLEFARAGASMPQLDALRLTGVDLDSPNTIKAGFQTLEDRVNRLEKLLG